MADVTLPQLGETVTEGTITKWFKKVGDTVRADEPLFEVSTDKVDSEERKSWVINTVGSYLLAHTGVTYHQRVPLPELPTKPAHDLPRAELTEAMAAWKIECAKARQQRASEEARHLSELGAPVHVVWAREMSGRYLETLVNRMKPECPKWLWECYRQRKPVHAFMPDTDLDEAMSEIVQCLNSPLPEMKRLTFRQFDQMLSLARNTDLEKRVGQLERARRLERINREQGRGFAELGLRLMFRLPSGHHWVQLVPTPDELAGGCVAFTARGVDTKTLYRSILDECQEMSNGQGVAHFCIANGSYDSYLEGEGMILSLRDSKKDRKSTRLNSSHRT